MAGYGAAKTNSGDLYGISGFESNLRAANCTWCFATYACAVVQQGTTQRQKVVTGTLFDLADKVEAAKLKPPSLIIVGEVVKLRETLNWFKPNNL